MRWAGTISQYNYHLQYRQGTLAKLPDELSRRPQDLSKDENDARLAIRLDQVLRPISITNFETTQDKEKEKQDKEEEKQDKEDKNMENKEKEEINNNRKEDESELHAANYEHGPPTSPFDNEELGNLWNEAVKKND